VKSPISVRDQWSTHKAGTAFNSSSTRYTEVKREFYIPKEFRKQSTSNRQGSEGTLDEGPAYLAQRVYESACNSAFDEYEYMIKLGAAKELAREVLPLCTYTTFVFTMSLMAVAHFIKLRTEEHAQEEIKMYALAMKELVKPLFPVSMKALLG
jgi:thymidylate synthase (FAD)